MGQDGTVKGLAAGETKKRRDRRTVKSSTKAHRQATGDIDDPDYGQRDIAKVNNVGTQANLQTTKRTLRKRKLDQEDRDAQSQTNHHARGPR